MSENVGVEDDRTTTSSDPSSVFSGGLGLRTKTRLANRLKAIEGRQEHTKSLVEGFDLKRAHKYRSFLNEYRRWEENLTNECLGTARGQKALVDILGTIERLGRRDVKVNVGQLIAGADDIRIVDDDKDGTDRYYVAVAGSREVWIGRAEVGECAKHRRGKRVDPTARCTCHYTVCVVCRWGDDLTKLSRHASLLKDTTPKSTRQVRYLTDNLGTRLSLPSLSLSIFLSL